jgi:hypothetical protein
LKVKEENISVEVITMRMSEINNIEDSTPFLMFLFTSQVRPIACFSFKISVCCIHHPRALFPLGLIRFIPDGFIAFKLMTL